MQLLKEEGQRPSAHPRCPHSTSHPPGAAHGMGPELQVGVGEIPVIHGGLQRLQRVMLSNAAGLLSPTLSTHRAELCPFPSWDLPFAGWVLPTPHVGSPIRC